MQLYFGNMVVLKTINLRLDLKKGKKTMYEAKAKNHKNAQEFLITFIAITNSCILLSLSYQNV